MDWVVSNYYLVYYTWSWLDFINAVSFIFGAYFFGILSRGKVTVWEKVIFVLACIPTFFLTVSGTSVLGFTQSVCEAINNDWSTYLKLLAEGIAVLSILFSIYINWKKSDRAKRIQLSVVSVAILLFFVVFGGTEYYSSVTGIYEVNLYGLFVLPVFLIVMMFAVTNLGVFDFRLLGSQIFSYALIITSGSQLLLIQNQTQTILSVITVGISIVFALLLLQNAQKEESARLKIIELAGELKTANDRLKQLDQMKSEFLSVASHQLRAPITAIKGYIANISDGSYGPLPDYLINPLAVVQESTRVMTSSIEDYLNVSRIEQGRMKYEIAPVDVTALAQRATEEMKPIAVKKGLKLEFADSPSVTVNADFGKIKQVFTNLIDNAVKYTEQGSVTVSIMKTDTAVRFMTQDTGIGIDPAEIDGLFAKFIRARDANKVNTTGTGLGLYVAKQLVEGQGGKVWAESDGKGKGSRFIVELPLVSAPAAPEPMAAPTSASTA